jgi:hypothetical protein
MSTLKTLKRLWSADFGWWSVPITAVLAAVIAAVLTHTLFAPLHGDDTSYVAVNVGWSRSFEIGALAGVFAAVISAYTELRRHLTRRMRARQQHVYSFIEHACGDRACVNPEHLKVKP